MTLSASMLEPMRWQAASRISRRISWLVARVIMQGLIIVVALALSGAVACRDVRGNGSGQTSPPNQWDASTPWTVRVCGSESSRVDIRAGRSKAGGDFFATWHVDERVKSYVLPADVQGLDQVYVRVETTSDMLTEVCIVHRGETKKRMKFDHWSQEGLISTADKDICGC